jgi:outer membrane protein OmpA-like peptidoglycan-associated protein
VSVVDGDPRGFTLVNRATDQTDTEFTYVLPAPTTFDRFAVPNVLETPSPFQTFTRRVEVHGSATGPGEGFVLLASADLETHAARGEETTLAIAASVPVRWVRVRLVGGIEMLRDQMFLEFSEIIGNGTQELPAHSDRFQGTWQGRGVAISLEQNGSVVSGCYDRTGDLSGTVTGNMLRATGIDRDDSTLSAFILNVADDGTLRGVRSSNGAPFRLYTSAMAAEGAAIRCATPAPPTLGCGSVIHGINFDFDSADIRPDSEGVLRELHAGLAADASAAIVIEGHTSSEGADAYNQALSERRAQAVVADLVRRGLGVSRVSATGIGETRPIATNDNESGRSLNRRVEVRCQ